MGLPYSESRLPAVFSWDSSVAGVAKFARYACLAFEDFALNVPRYWSLREHPVITVKTYTMLEDGDRPAYTALERRLGTESLPSLGEEPDFSLLPLRADEAKALADLDQIVEETGAICHRTTVSRLAADMGALPGWHIYDNAATNTIRQALIAHGFNDLDEAVAEYAKLLIKPPSTRYLRFRLASNIAYLYVARSIPYLGLLPVDLVLEWRSALHDSLEAYRARVDEIVERSWAGERATQLERLTERITYELDQEFEQVQRDAKGQPLWKAMREALPGIAGTTVGITIEFVVGLANPSLQVW